MLYLKIDPQGAITAISTEYPAECKTCKDGSCWARDTIAGIFHPAGGWIDRNDIQTFEHAQALALAATEFAGEFYLATDAGPNQSPRYDVIRAPHVGDLVSKSINGDSYPCGKVIRVSRGCNTVLTDTGAKFIRKGDTGGWKIARGYAWMVGGHIDERNPSF